MNMCVNLNESSFRCCHIFHSFLFNLYLYICAENALNCSMAHIYSVSKFFSIFESYSKYILWLYWVYEIVCNIKYYWLLLLVDILSVVFHSFSKILNMCLSDHRFVILNCWLKTQIDESWKSYKYFFLLLHSKFFFFSFYYTHCNYLFNSSYPLLLLWIKQPMHNSNWRLITSHQYVRMKMKMWCWSLENHLSHH